MSVCMPLFQSAPDLEAARKVLSLEAEGIQQLAAGLDGVFCEVVEMGARLKGRFITCGIGKSGYIARKISATLSSTGTPSMFLHPAEASHGDLGGVTREDALLVLSNSGETSELSDIIQFSKRFSIPLVGITSQKESTLAKAADFCLLLPPVEEACPMKLAPTTSTTLMIALGDALAVALLKRKGFTADDFYRFHPGGSLGRRLLKVQEVMRADHELPLILEGASLDEALEQMSAHNFGCVGIIDEKGVLKGILTDGDLRRHLIRGAVSKDLQDLMTSSPKTIHGDSLMAEAVAVMNSLGITGLFVVDEERRPMGLVRLHDCLMKGVG